MIIIIRSDYNTHAKFKKGDKYISSSVIGFGSNQIIEYVVNRPVYTYCIKSIQLDKFIKVLPKDKEPKFVDIASDATYFRSYKAAKEYLQREIGQENAKNLRLNIMESVE